MAEKNRKKKRDIRRKQGHGLVWLTLFVILIPVVFILYVLATSAVGQDKPVPGDRFQGNDLNPKITKENVEEVQSRMSSISGVDNVTVNLKSATLRINLDMGDSMDTDAITDAVDEAYDIIDSMLPIGTYFTNHDDGKMYDLEINGYNFIPAEGQDTGGQVIVEITKTGAGKKTTDVLTKPRDKDLVDEITR